MLPVPVEQLSGPLIVGYLLNWGLFGTLSVQLYLYYLAFPKDRRSIKSLVYGIYIVEFVQTMIITHDAFAVFGYGFGNMEALTSTDNQFYWLVVPIIGTMAASIGQGFYAYRIYILSRSGIVPAFVICMSLTSFVAAIVTGAYMFQASDIIQLNNQKTSISLGISCAGYALCDIVIAICMTYNLMRHNTSLPQTRILITKLIRLTIETGSLTAVVALAALILFFAYPHQFFYVTPGLVISKLYANTIYMVLNSRIRIVGGRDIYTSSTDMEITTTMMRDITSHSTQGAQRTPTVVISTEVFSSDHEMGRMDEKPQDSDMSLLA
ncbi:hypothetical protein ARMGADRAFT_989737 [Armillaria gallica]|uniref:DUF6534 domain-containing protein n=1 Tax=Armillaria gallica TaxID=47427 RepID=A0A2H3E852_ARMGA|nr:hypothetical protein ARMGADRAFT_989737 [Armillaria gallica]